jgi:hypothetical protein
LAIFPSASDPPVADAPPNPLSLGVFEPGGVVSGEGTAEGQIFVSNLFFGGVRVVDTETGEIRVLVGNDIYMQRLAYGMEYYLPSNALFVSGAEYNLTGNNYVGEIRIYDVASGDLLSTCTDESSFPTDVAFVDEYAYATNSANNTILRLDIESALSGCCTFETIPLPETFKPCDDTVDGEFVQGIAGYDGGIAFIASENGKTGLYFMNPETLDIVMLAEAPELGGDLLVFGQHLYMSDSEVNEIAVFALSSVNGTVSATRVDTLTSEYYQGPTYLTLFQDQFLYSVNSIGTDTGDDFDEYSAVFSPIGTSVDPAPIPLLSEIPLGLMHPGGIVAASSGPVIYVTNLFFGGVRVVDLTTGELFVLHPNSRYLAKTVYGLDLEKETETLFIAGTELVENLLEGRIYVLDAVTGEQIVACSIDEDFYPTDIAIVGDKAYATNSLGSNLVSISVSAAVNGTCETEILDLPEEVFNFTLFDIETVLGMCGFFDDIFGNDVKQKACCCCLFLLIFSSFCVFLPPGITGYAEGLIISSPPGNDESGLYYFAIAADTVARIADGPAEGGGLLVVGDTLYVTDTAANTVLVLALAYDTCESTVNATHVGVLESPLYDAPLFSAAYDQTLYSVNSIFSDAVSPPETFLLHSVDMMNVTPSILC